MQSNTIAIVGAAETTEMGRIPDVSQIQLHADAALNAVDDAGLKLSDIDGIATAGESPNSLAHYLGLVPTWVDGTGVGGCSFMLHVRHAAAAINEGLCHTVLITHGESGRSNVGRGAFRGGGRSTLKVWLSPCLALEFPHSSGPRILQLTRSALSREWCT